MIPRTYAETALPETACQTLWRPVVLLHVPFTFLPRSSRRNRGVCGGVSPLSWQGLDSRARSCRPPAERYSMKALLSIGCPWSGPSLARAHGARTKPLPRRFAASSRTPQNRSAAHCFRVGAACRTKYQRMGARVVFTYHLPAASCARGSMVCGSEGPCDGGLQVHRAPLLAPEARRATDSPRSARRGAQVEDQGTLISAELAGGPFTAIHVADGRRWPSTFSGHDGQVDQVVVAGLRLGRRCVANQWRACFRR